MFYIFDELLVKRIFRYLLYVLMGLLPMAAIAKPIVTGYRIADNIETSRFVISLSEWGNYTLLMLQHPDRLVVDIHDGNWKADPSQCFPASTLVKQVRHGLKDAHTLRIVLDLTKPVFVKDSFQISPKENKFFRIVVDMKPKVMQDFPSNASPPVETSPEAMQIPPLQPEATVPPIVAESSTLPQGAEPIPQGAPAPVAPPVKLQDASQQPSPVQATPIPPLTSIPKAAPPKLPLTPIPTAKSTSVAVKPLIIIDPGHGGEDPGTIGRTYKTYEKKLTLQYAMLLKKRLERTGHYRVELTRTGDYYISLGSRVNKAREKQASIFISLHADSHPQPSMRGLSVYTLSETASDKESEALAAKENKADVIKSINLKGQSPEVANILINLMQRDTINSSVEFAEMAVRELGKEITILPNAHRFAGFKVLKGVDVAAVLIELGYLSNKEEERLLSSSNYQKKIIDALIMSIDKYFKARKPTAP